MAHASHYMRRLCLPLSLTLGKSTGKTSGSRLETLKHRGDGQTAVNGVAGTMQANGARHGTEHVMMELFDEGRSRGAIDLSMCV